MGLFGSDKDDTRAKIEELKSKMQQANQNPQQQAPVQQQQQPPQEPAQQQNQQQPPQQQPAEQQQGWQPPRQKPNNPPQQAPAKKKPSISNDKQVLLDLGQGMTLNLPIREQMELDEFLQIADRVRKLEKINHS